MAKRRGSMIERILKRVEDHVEEYRAQEKIREAEILSALARSPSQAR